MLHQIVQHTQPGAVADLQDRFSTTTDFDQVLSTATIMDTFKHYFKYERVILSCGIAAVHMTGTSEDWHGMLPRVDALTKYDAGDGALIRYVAHVRVIVQQFASTFDGRVDVNWWNSVCAHSSEKRQEGSFGFERSVTYLNGWITHLYGVYRRIEFDDFLSMEVPAMEVDIQMHNQWTGATKEMKMTGGGAYVECIDGKIYRPGYALMVYYNNHTPSDTESQDPGTAHTCLDCRD
jgi:hypothetical protein